MNNLHLTIAICNYNTTALTNNCISSILKHIHIPYKIIVLDNSDIDKFTTTYDCKIIDNTDEKYIQFSNIIDSLDRSKCAALIHTYSILFLLNICCTRHLLLLDSDVTIVNDLNFIDLNDNTYITISDNLQKWISTKNGHEKYARFIPFILLFNVDLISKHNIKYYSFNHILHGVSNTSTHYDTGSYFYEQVLNKKLYSKLINFAYYIKHLFSGSENKTPTTNFLKQNNNYDCIVSLTSWFPRFNELVSNIKSLLLLKTTYSYKLILTLTQEDLNLLPLNVKILISLNTNTEIIIADKDIKAHKKYYYTMLKYRTIPIITVDDDVIYDLNLVQSFMNEHLQHKNCIIAGRMHRIIINNGNIEKYNNWKHDILISEISKLNFATGVGGVLYPPDCLKISNCDMFDICNTYKWNDDFFLKDRELKYNLSVKKLQSLQKTFKMLHSSLDKCALAYVNTLNSNLNDCAILEIQKRYKDKLEIKYE